MAPTDPTRSGRAGTGLPDAPPTSGDGPLSSGDEPLTADLATRPPRVSTRALVVAAVVLAALLVVSVVVGFVVLHQPRLTPVPVPSVPSIA